METPVEVTAESKPGKDSVFGLDQNVTALIGWLLPIVAIILLFTEKTNKFVKFHAWQSVAWSVGLPVGLFIISFLAGVFTWFLPDVIANAFGLMITCLNCLAIFAYAGNIIGAIKAYGNEMYKLPFVGNFAEKQAMK